MQYLDEKRHPGKKIIEHRCVKFATKQTFIIENYFSTRFRQKMFPSTVPTFYLPYIMRYAFKT